MDPASFTLTVIAAFKDVYLVAKFIQKTAGSTKHSKSEQKIVLEEFKIEILHLKSFWRLFTRKDGNLVDDDLLNAEWLESVKLIIEQLRFIFSDYAKIAADIDDDYRKYSPYSGHTIDCPISEFPLEIEDVEDKKESAGKKGITKFFSRITDFTVARRSGVELAHALQWALFEKDKLETTLKHFVKWNQKLKELVPHLLDSGHYLKNPERVSRLMEHDTVNIFAPHIRLGQIAQDPEAETKGTQLLLSHDSSEAKGLQQILSKNVAKPKTRMLVEYKSYGIPFDPDEETDAEVDLVSLESELYPRQLASLLETAGANDFRTLPFKGYLKDQSKSQYAFFFDYPRLAGDHEPQSLHDLIVMKGSKEKLSLQHRFHIARTISQSIGAFHSDGWVHKSIRSHAVKFFFNKDDECDLESPFLTDFEFSRPEAGETRLIGEDPDPERDIYRHPERYGPPSTSFNKVHDIYSLGIVLLEIGLWEPARGMYDEIRGELRRRDLHLNNPSPALIRKSLLRDAERRLGHRMGSAYKEAVVSCLSDQFKEYLGKDDFAMTFQKLVVQKVDIKRLLETSD